MGRVIGALLPGILLSYYYFGVGVLIHCLLAIIFALLFEAIVLKLRSLPIRLAIQDRSAIVTALLFALSLSPYSPWWFTFIGIAFAIVLAKHAFGGLGQNPFNPAMAGYVFVLLCFPVQMSFWPDLSSATSPAGSDVIRIIFGLSEDVDAMSGATPLANMQLELKLLSMVSEVKSGPLYGTFAGRGWEWVALAYLAGGLFLTFNKIISWQIPTAVLGTLFGLSLLFNGIDAEIYPTVFDHLFSGGAILCAFFIATDPASSATTPLGKILYGIGIGSLIYIIRTWGSYPDGIAFAILIMNGFVPFIDYYTRPKILGEQ